MSIELPSDLTSLVNEYTTTSFRLKSNNLSIYLGKRKVEMKVRPGLWLTYLTPRFYYGVAIRALLLQYEGAAKQNLLPSLAIPSSTGISQGLATITDDHILLCSTSENTGSIPILNVMLERDPNTEPVKVISVIASDDVVIILLKHFNFGIGVKAEAAVGRDFGYSLWLAAYKVGLDKHLTRSRDEFELHNLTRNDLIRLFTPEEIKQLGNIGTSLLGQGRIYLFFEKNEMKGSRYTTVNVGYDCSWLSSSGLKEEPLFNDIKISFPGGLERIDTQNLADAMTHTTSEEFDKEVEERYGEEYEQAYKILYAKNPYQF